MRYPISILILLLFACPVFGQKTTTTADRLIARESFQLVGVKMTGITADTLLVGVNHFQLPTAFSVKKYADWYMAGKKFTNQSPTDGQIPKYNATTGKWEFAADGGGGGGSVSEPANQVVYGTGAAVDSEAGFEYNSTTNQLKTDTVRANRVVAQIWDKGKQGAVYNVAAYGVMPDGTDQTSRFLGLLATMLANGGGVVQFNPGKYRLNGRVFLPVDANSPPRIANQKWVGAGAHQSGNGQLPNGGTILDLRYSGDTVGRIVCRGNGLLEMEGITFACDVANATPIIQTTNTTLLIHDCAFLGLSTASRTDAIVLGGESTGAGSDTTFNMPFQGYGTVIADNFFNYVGRVVNFKTYANAIIVRNNNVWNGCGGDASHPAFDLTPSLDNCVGNVIEGNLIEMNAYPYGIVFNNLCSRNTFAYNNFYDPTGVTKANIRYTGAVSHDNTIITGSVGGAVDDVYDPTFSGLLLTGRSGDTCQIMNYLRAPNQFMTQFGERLYAANGNYAQMWFASPGNNDLYLSHTPSGGSAQDYGVFRDFGGGTKEFQFSGATVSARLTNNAGNMSIWAKGTTGELYLGQSNNLNHLFYNGTLYGGMTATTTALKIGQGDKLVWGDTSNPLSGDGATIVSNANQQLSMPMTGSLSLPSGTTGERPASPTNGMTRYNSTLGKFEGYESGAWANFVQAPLSGTTAARPAANTVTAGSSYWNTDLGEEQIAEPTNNVWHSQPGTKLISTASNITIQPGIGTNDLPNGGTLKLNNLTSAITITLKQAGASAYKAGDKIYLKTTTGVSGTNTVTIDPEGSTQIESGAGYANTRVITIPFTFLTLVFNGTEWNIIAG